MGSLVNMNVPRRFEAGTNFQYVLRSKTLHRSCADVVSFPTQLRRCAMWHEFPH